MSRWQTQSLLFHYSQFNHIFSRIVIETAIRYSLCSVLCKYLPFACVTLHFYKSSRISNVSRLCLSSKFYLVIIYRIHILFRILYWRYLLRFTQVAIRALFLGYVFGIGILISITASPSWQIFGIYMAVLATFHYSEFLAIAWANPATLSTDSFILNHSIAYGVAACLSWIEFFIERYYFHEMKLPTLVSFFGLLLCIFGEILRKLAMCTAKHNFNHYVQSEKSDNHQLVTHGVYNLCRHPSYVGWFYWSLGTQVRIAS